VAGVVDEHVHAAEALTGGRDGGVDLLSAADVERDGEHAIGRGRDEVVERLGAAIPGQPRELGTQEQFIYNKDFHSQVVLASGNTLLSISAQPIFSVMQTNLSRSNLGRRFHDQVNHDHRAIAEAIAAGDEERAAEEMRRHLHFLRPAYERAWRRRNGR
jgi:DNA-binding FadR family transcriptional regulator